MKYKQIGMVILSIVAALGMMGCGREPSKLLRQGLLPIYDFPLYLTEGSTGQLWKISKDRSLKLVVSGLQDPRGIATDRFGNVYIAEYGAGRLLKIASGSSSYKVLQDGLEGPSVVSVDSFGEVYVAQDGKRTIMRISDNKVFGTFSALPTAFAFGVDDKPIVGLLDQNKVYWGWKVSDPAADVSAPVNVSIDGTGRVYVAQGDASNGKVYRFNQRTPGKSTLVADSLLGPSGIATDLVGNIFIVEKGPGRIDLVTYSGKAYSWISNLDDPQYLAFTQY